MSHHYSGPDFGFPQGDTDGNAVADIAYRVRFSISEVGLQTATVRRVVGAQAAGMDDSGHGGSDERND
jgi:hypothetical protein